MIFDNTFLTTINVIPNPIVITNGEKLLVANTKFLEFFGLETVEEAKKHVNCICEFFVGHKDYFSLDEVPEDEHWIEHLYKRQENVKVSLLDKDGEGRAFEVSVAKLDIYDAYIVVFTDITALQNEKKLLEKLAYMDPLTNIYNRAMFQARLKEMYSMKQRHNEDIALVMIDIDYFKQVNDTYGHDVGDKVLVKLTQLIRSNIREADVFARWGGEEFILLMPKTKLDAAAKKAEELRQLIETYVDDEIPKFTVSFGVTEIEQQDKDRSCFKRADQALYMAKQTRNKVVSLS